MSNLVFCGSCGRQQPQPVPATCPFCGGKPVGGKRYKQKSLAGVLALLLGGLGVHRFYLGQWWGVFYLLFFWTLIPGLIALVEGIVFLCTDDEKWDRRFNQGAGRGQADAGALIVILAVVGFGAVAMLGIVAAIAVPAYVEYTNRAQMTEVSAYAQQATVAVTAHYTETEEIPATLTDAGVKAPLPQVLSEAHIDPESGVISLTFGTGGLTGKTLHLLPQQDENGAIQWLCRGKGLGYSILPRWCRGTPEEEEV
ncbi:NINE protein [Chitiniphilus eburneus]|nr:NINE protein [Chitiniphilus eburneus]